MKECSRRPRWLILAVQLAALGVAYVASAELGRMVAPECPWATFFYTPIGVGLAALVMGGFRLAPGIAISTFAACEVILGRSPLVAGAIALSHTLACLAGALVVQRVSNFHRSLDRLRDLFVALVLAGTVASLLDTLGGAISVTLGGIAPAADFVHTFGGWLSGAVVAIFVVSPVLMTCLVRPVARPRWSVLAETVALGVLVVVCTALVFRQPPAEAVFHPLLQPYVLIFPLIWAAVRFGVRGASAANLTVAFLAAYQTYTGHGPFVRPDRIDSLNALHVYLASTSLASLALGAVAYERVRSERELAAIVESCSDAVIGRGRNGRITSWNAAAARLYGYSPEEAIGRPLSMLFPPEGQEEAMHLFERLGRGEAIENHETVRLHKDGTRLDVSVTWSPIRERTGAVVGASSIVRGLGESAERWRLASEAAHLGMWYWKIDEGHVVWTPLCRKMFGIGPDEDVNQGRWLSLVHPGDRERVRATIERAVATRSDYSAEYRVVWSDGSIHWISSLGRFFSAGKERSDRMLGVVLDVTARKLAEQERAELLERERAALAEARAATRAKDEFLAMVSHELRTPLQTVLGWTGMLKARLQDVAFVQRGLSTIERNIRMQAQLVEDLLDLSRMVRGRLRIERTRVDLAEVVEAAVDAARIAAVEKSIRLEASIAPDAGDVLGDPNRLQQVVCNLVTNAVKFTPKGGLVQVQLERDDATVTIVVADNGRGISPEFLPHIFERFRQEDSGATQRHGGLGLGLAIVRYLVEEHRGTIQAESPGEGRGATFTVTLPLLGATRAPPMEERVEPRLPE